MVYKIMGPRRCGLYSRGLYSHGLYSYGLQPLPRWASTPTNVVMVCTPTAYMVMACIVMARTASHGLCSHGLYEYGV